jgi:hypothetical protein
MAEIQRDIKDLKKSQKTANELLVQHIKTSTDSHQEVKEIVKRHDIVLFGDEELGIKGHNQEIKELRESIQPFLSFLSNAKLLWTILGVIGISTVKDLIELIRPFVLKVLAGN